MAALMTAAATSRAAGARIDTMNCQDLARRIQELEPLASTQDVARLCLLLANTQADLDSLSDGESLRKAWQDTCLKLQFATDQHAAMTQELEDLAKSDPAKYSRDQVWILIRAIKVQSQVLQLYVGQALLDV
jgi:hypothetical protein